MRTVLLFRHGKSDWNAEYNKDYERPLANRGILAAKKMGMYLEKKNEIPELVISSTANRAHSTALLAIESGNWNSIMELSECLYLASHSTIISLIGKQKNKYNSICIVGHEPTMSSFIENKTTNGSIKYPTATMAMITFDIDFWSDIIHTAGTLKWFVRPKEIK
tara:strand:+ start:189 stop:680 length:492 start_codon:yes stop_codon:yes gene_type:complete